MTKEIRKVLEFQPPISLEHTLNDYLPLDPHAVFTKDEGGKVSNQLYSFHSYGTNTPPYTYKQPKQPKPPDKLT